MNSQEFLDESVLNSESALSAYEQVMREVERVESFREQMRRETEIIVSVLSRGIEEIRWQSELKSFIINKVLGNDGRENEKSTSPNISNYCREWDWELYSLTDYYWYYCPNLYFDAN